MHRRVIGLVVISWKNSCETGAGDRAEGIILRNRGGMAHLYHRRWALTGQIKIRTGEQRQSERVVPPIDFLFRSRVCMADRDFGGSAGRVATGRISLASKHLFPTRAC